MPTTDSRSLLMRYSRNTRVILVCGATALAVGFGGYAATVPSEARGTAYRAFKADSWWNTPLGPNPPTSTRSATYLNYMRTAADAGGGCVRLAGTGSNSWGQPVYWAKPHHREYNVRVSGMSRKPAALRHLRIPRTARAAATSDAAMTVFDRSRGYVVALTGAHFTSATRTWSARGATVTYLSSNGLHRKTGRSDDRRNWGSHRGNNGATMMVRYGEVASGAIRHVLKVASGPETSYRSVFPMVGSDGDSSRSSAPPQGMRFRIKPSVNLDAMRLHPQARVIAKALQRYGMYLGDNAGNTTLKLQDTRASGRGQLWRLSSTALCSLPLSSRYWEVVRGGYDPSR